MCSERWVWTQLWIPGTPHPSTETLSQTSKSWARAEDRGPYCRLVVIWVRVFDPSIVQLAQPLPRSAARGWATRFQRTQKLSLSGAMYGTARSLSPCWHLPTWSLQQSQDGSCSQGPLFVGIVFKWQQYGSLHHCAIQIVIWVPYYIAR